MKNLIMIAILVLIVSVVALNIEPKQQPVFVEGEMTDVIDANKLMDTVQAWKLKTHHYKYKIDDRLCGFAELRATQIQNDWSHKGFRNLAPMRYQEMPEYNRMGENLIELQMIYKEPESKLYPKLLKMWLDSPGHKKNLDTNFTHSCIACENNYCVQLFAK